MLDKSNLTTKCTSFSRTQNKFRSRSYHTSNDAIGNPIEILKQQLPRKKISLLDCPIIERPNDHESLFSKAVTEQLLYFNAEPYLQQLAVCISYCLDNESLKGLGQLISLTADIMFKIKHYQYACFFYNQSRILHGHTRNFPGKTKSLIGLAKCCTELKLLQESQTFLKKALQYAWFASSEDELSIYEHMAKNYFYMGLRDQSFYFHERGLIGVPEDDKSPIKQFSKETLKDYLKKQQFSFDRLTPLLLHYLSVPVMSFVDLPPKVKPKEPLRQYVRKISFYPQPEDLVIGILEKDADFSTMINTPRYQSLAASKEFVHFRETKLVFKRKHASSFVQDYNPVNRSMLRKSVDEQVRERLSEPPINEDIDSIIREKVRSRQRGKHFDLRAPILVNHEFKEEKHYMKNKGCLQRQIRKIFSAYQE